MEAARSTFCIIVLCYLSTEAHSLNHVEEDINKLSTANAFFANELYKQLSKDSSNLIFSPLTISMALSMLNVGASGNTSQELNSTLGWSFARLNEQELLQGYHNLFTKLTEVRDGYQFSLANAQFVRNSIHIYSNYTTSIEDVFHAVIRGVDFRNTETTLREINDWVNTATTNRITSILDNISTSDIMTVVNAGYFNGQWLHKFGHSDTEDVDFFTADGTRKLVNMMVQVLSVKHNLTHATGASVLELPYKSNLFSMIFMKPELGSSLSELEEKLTPELLVEINRDLQTGDVIVGIPKINMESSINLSPHLQEMGVRNAFRDSADFSRMSSSTVKVTQAVHKAAMKWTEEGSEDSPVSASSLDRISERFWLNRPFMFFLRHNPTGVICFMGKVSDV